MPFNMLPEVLGLKFPTLIAGVIGGIISLSFIRNLSLFKGFTALLAGSFCAGYWTAPLAAYIGVSPDSDNAIAFFIGVVGMNLIAGIYKLFEAFSEKPLQTIKEWRGKS